MGDDQIVHPRHYNQGPKADDGTAKFEVIKVVEDLGWGFEFCMANALKYVLRAPYKGKEVSDLRKAQFYLLRARKGGRVRARWFRRFDIRDVIDGWGLAGDELSVNAGRLSAVVAAISEGDPFSALEHLNMYMLRFGTGEEKEPGDASTGGDEAKE